MINPQQNLSKTCHDYNEIRLVISKINKKVEDQKDLLINYIFLKVL